MQTERVGGVRFLFSGNAREKGGLVVIHPETKSVHVSHKEYRVGNPGEHNYVEHLHVMHALGKWLQDNRGVPAFRVDENRTIRARVLPEGRLEIETLPPEKEILAIGDRYGKKYGTYQQILRSQKAMDVLSELQKAYMLGPNDVYFRIWGEGKTISMAQALGEQVRQRPQVIPFGNVEKGGIFVMVPGKNLIGISYRNNPTLEHANLVPAIGADPKKHLVIEGGIDKRGKRIWIRTTRLRTGPLAPTEANVLKNAGHLINELKKRYGISKVEFGSKF
ncbi:MAG: hypothetical protein WC792_00455 [Candidatus Micrarchaeia archaeon]|jgi:hypothetical protein